MLYHYKAVCTEVYDGDTITVDIDLGFGNWMHNQKLRLFGINAPEMRGLERDVGIKSRDWLRETILNKNVEIETIKDSKEKYGRWLVIVFMLQPNGVTLNINKTLLSLGLAKEVNY